MKVVLVFICSQQCSQVYGSTQWRGLEAGEGMSEKGEEFHLYTVVKILQPRGVQMGACICASSQSNQATPAEFLICIVFRYVNQRPVVRAYYSWPKS